MIYAATLIAACFLNKENFKTVLFCLLVALTKYLPLEYITNYYVWYSICTAVEISVITSCLFMKLRVTTALLPVTIMMLYCHLASFFYGNLVSYALVMPVLEYMQILSFIITSQPIITRIKGRMKCLQKYGCGY